MPFWFITPIKAIAAFFHEKKARWVYLKKKAVDNYTLPVHSRESAMIGASLT
jgi:hypothetical protein